MHKKSIKFVTCNKNLMIIILIYKETLLGRTQLSTSINFSISSSLLTILFNKSFSLQRQSRSSNQRSPIVDQSRVLMIFKAENDLSQDVELKVIAQVITHNKCTLTHASLSLKTCLQTSLMVHLFNFYNDMFDVKCIFS